MKRARKRRRGRDRTSKNIILLACLTWGKADRFLPLVFMVSGGFEDLWWSSLSSLRGTWALSSNVEGSKRTAEFQMNFSPSCFLSPKSVSVKAFARFTRGFEVCLSKPFRHFVVLAFHVPCSDPTNYALVGPLSRGGGITAGFDRRSLAFYAMNRKAPKVVKGFSWHIHSSFAVQSNYSEWRSIRSRPRRPRKRRRRRRKGQAFFFMSWLKRIIHNGPAFATQRKHIIRAEKDVGKARTETSFSCSTDPLDFRKHMNNRPSLCEPMEKSLWWSHFVPRWSGNLIAGAK